MNHANPKIFKVILMSINTVQSILIEKDVLVFAHKVSEFWALHLSGTRMIDRLHNFYEVIIRLNAVDTLLL